MKRIKEKLEAMAAAVAFAEAGQWDDANEIARSGQEKRTDKRDRKQEQPRQRPRPRAYRT